MCIEPNTCTKEHVNNVTEKLFFIAFHFDLLVTEYYIMVKENNLNNYKRLN